MNRLELKNQTYSTLQLFFLERTVELLHRNTIDSYRARVLSPLSILNELLQTIEEFKEGTILYFEPTVTDIIHETKLLLDSENELNFDQFSKKEFEKQLIEPKAENLYKLELLTRILVDKNSSYTSVLVAKLKSFLTSTGNEPNCFFNSLKAIDYLTGYLFTELINKGYSKRYLYRSINHLFISNKDSVFIDTFDEFFGFLTKSTPEKYFIYFKSSLPNEINNHVVALSRDINITKNLSHLKIETEKGKKTISSFLKTSNNINFFEVAVEAYDYFNALKTGRVKISETFDLLGLGFSDVNLSIYDHVLIVSERDVNNWEYLKYKYELDGNYNYGITLFNSFSEKIKSINERKEIQMETKDKISSAIRYLRLGNEALEVEHKFINYWFGLEYLFSTNIAKQRTIQRIKTYFNKLYSVRYINRLKSNLHADIKRMQVEKKISKFDTELKYLNDPNIYDEIFKIHLPEHPLLAYRSAVLKRLFFDKKETKKVIKIHEKNLEYHFTRIYRIRNKIVHDAAKNINILIITANLKYYLAYSLNLVINSFQENKSLKSIQEIFVLSEVNYSELIESNDLDSLKLLDSKLNQDFSL